MSEQQKTWLSVQVIYKHGNELKSMVSRNWSWQKVKEFRETVFVSGYMVPVFDSTNIDTGAFIIISPWNIVSIDVQKQDHFFENI